MDLLYSRYASPMEFIRLYIDDGRFGEFVSEIIEMNIKRKQEEADKENDDKLWQLYVHSMPDMAFNEWKSSVLNGTQQQKQPDSYAMTDEQISETLEKSREILKGFNMKK